MTNAHKNHCAGHRFAVLIGGFMALIVVLAAAEIFNLVDIAHVKRAVAAIFGLILFTAGNALPKFVTPIADRVSDESATIARAKSFERFSGVSFALAGVFCIGAALFAPALWVIELSSIIAIASFLIVGARWINFQRTPIHHALSPAQKAGSPAQKAGGDQPQETSMTTRKNNGRGAMIQILHALFWAFAMLLAASIWGGEPWGEQIVPWMAVAYILANGLLLTALGSKSKDRC